MTRSLRSLAGFCRWEYGKISPGKNIITTTMTLQDKKHKSISTIFTISTICNTAVFRVFQVFIIYFYCLFMGKDHKYHKIFWIAIFLMKNVKLLNL